jgi:hypothetical protein
MWQTMNRCKSYWIVDPIWNIFPRRVFFWWYGSFSSKWEWFLPEIHQQRSSLPHFVAKKKTRVPTFFLKCWRFCFPMWTPVNIHQRLKLNNLMHGFKPLYRITKFWVNFIKFLEYDNLGSFVLPTSTFT